MHAFLRGDADVLVSTTIIESGPRHPAGEHADRRAGRRARARPALPDPRAGRPLRRARARLPLLSRLARADRRRRGRGWRRSPTTPSSAPGFAIAMRDLEIRGAGDLLGAEQSGHVAALGFELYVELLGEAVAELSASGGRSRARFASTRASTRTCPPTYIAAEALKIDLHRRLALAESDDELRELRAATEDRYGPLPEPVENLFSIQEAKLKLARLGADYLVFKGGRATVGPLELGSAELRALRSEVDDGGLHDRPARGLRPRRGFFGSAPAGRCYTRRAPGSMSKTACSWRFLHETDHSEFSLGVALVLAVSACGGGGPRSVPSDAVAVVGDSTISKAEWDALMAQTKHNYMATNHAVPEGGHGRARQPARERDAVPGPGERVRAAGREARHQGHRQGRRRAARPDQAAVLREPARPAAADARRRSRSATSRRSSSRASPTSRSAPGSSSRSSASASSKVTEDVKVSDSDIQTYYDKHKAQYATPAQPESRQVRHILVKKKALADQIYAQLQGEPGAVREARARSTRSTPVSGDGGRRARRAARQGPVREAVRERRLHDQDERDLQAGAHEVRLAHHRGARPDQAGRAREADAARAGQGGDQADAAPEPSATQAAQDWQKKTIKDYCKKIGYQAGYAPPPGQDPCKQSSTTGATATG